MESPGASLSNVFLPGFAFSIFFHLLIRTHVFVLLHESLNECCKDRKYNKNHKINIVFSLNTRKNGSRTMLRRHTSRVHS